MADVRVLRLFQIVEHRTSCHHTILQMLHPIAFQVLRAEVCQQLLPRSLVCVDPIVQFVGEELAAEIAFKHRAFASFKEYLFR